MRAFFISRGKASAWLGCTTGLAAVVGFAACQFAPEGGALTSDAGASQGDDSTITPLPQTTWFKEVTSASGITATHAPASMGDILYPLRASGIAVGDLDGDGKPDIVAPTGFGPTYVYRNAGALRFTDVTKASGVDGRSVSSSATLCDLDGDGKLDLLLGTDADQPDSDVRYFHGHGDATFDDRTAAAGLAVHGGVRTMLCADLDGDGLLDIYVANFGFEVTPGSPGLADALYRNQGDGTFVDIAARTPFDTIGYTWTAAANDFNGDGRLDLYVGNDTFINDFGTRPVQPWRDGFPIDSDYLFVGDGPGSDGYPAFHTLGSGLPPPPGVSGDAGAGDDGGDGGEGGAGGDSGTPDAMASGDADADGATPDDAGADAVAAADAGIDADPDAIIRELRATMGVVPADVTGDGIPDFLLSNFGRKALLQGSEAGVFSDQTAAFGLESTMRTDQACAPSSMVAQCLSVGWGTAFEDFDLDGHPDILMVAGQVTTSTADSEPQLLWKGGTSGGVSTYRPVPGTASGLPPMNARGLVAADLDGDGDLDLVATTWSGPVRVFENAAATVEQTSASWLDVRLHATTSAPEGRGAAVTVGGITRLVGVGGIIFSSAPAEARFGLGGATATGVVVRWPSGLVQNVGTVKTNQVLTVDEPAVVTVSRRVAPADGATTVAVVVTPSKSDGTPLGPGATVTIDATAGTWQGPVVDAGNGSYTRTLVAPAAPALAAVTLSVNGTALTAYPRVVFR